MLVVSLISILVLLVLIVLSCVIFTNAVEHLGDYYDLGHGAVGGILAAIGTALPETIVPLVAIFGAYLTESSVAVGREIGTGAILGSPFLLATLAMFMTGIAVVIFARLKFRSNKINIDVSLLLRDLRFFLVSYTVAIFSTFVKVILFKYLIGAFLLVFYLVYVFRTIRKCSTDGCEEPEMDDLYFARFIALDNFKIAIIYFQIIFSILCLIFFSHLFVEKIRFVSLSLSIDPLIVSLLLAPIATELPEMFNSVLWSKGSKDVLAMSNITGAMVFQSCIPMSIGIFFTNWIFNTEVIINILLVYIAVLILYINAFKNNQFITPNVLIFSGIFYFIYIIYIAIRVIN